MLQFKPAVQVVKPQVITAKRKIHKVTPKTLVVNLDGTVSLFQDRFDWDYDKPNRAGE